MLYTRTPNLSSIVKKDCFESFFFDCFLISTSKFYILTLNLGFNIYQTKQNNTKHKLTKALVLFYWKLLCITTKFMFLLYIA